MSTVRKQKEVKMASIRKLKSGKWQVVIRKSNHKAIYKTFIEKAVARKWARTVEHTLTMTPGSYNLVTT